MFNWIRRWYRNRNRAIFRYWDGQRWRAADPIEIYRGIKQHPEFNIDRHPQLHDAGDDDATRICLQATRDVFGVKPFAEGGLTETETIEVLGTYFDWIQRVKKNGSGPPILPEPTVSPPHCGMDPGSKSADCSSTSAAPNSEGPLP